jgi:hypothetical protein
MRYAKRFAELYSGPMRENGRYGGFKHVSKEVLAARSMGDNIAALRKWANRGTGIGLVVLGRHSDGHVLSEHSPSDKAFVVDELHRLRNTIRVKVWADGATFCGERQWEMYTQSFLMDPHQWEQDGDALTMVRQQVTDRPLVVALCSRLRRPQVSAVLPRSGWQRCYRSSVVEWSCLVAQRRWWRGSFWSCTLYCQ